MQSVIVSIVSPSICHEVMGLDAMILEPRRSKEPLDESERGVKNLI